MNCKHCGDPIHATEHSWKHDHGLFSCQHTVPYGHQAEPPGEPCRYPCIGSDR